jgi:hypothetical protein
MVCRCTRVRPRPEPSTPTGRGSRRPRPRRRRRVRPRPVRMAVDQRQHRQHLPCQRRHWTPGVPDRDRPARWFRPRDRHVHETPLLSGVWTRVSVSLRAGRGGRSQPTGSDCAARVTFQPVGDHLIVCDVKKDGSSAVALYTRPDVPGEKQVGADRGNGTCFDENLDLPAGAKIVYRACTGHRPQKLILGCGQRVTDTA